MNTQPQDSRPQTADLDNPLYYLENMETVLRWVATHHRDLLLTTEYARLNAFFDLSRSARALLTRMVMRTGELFRADKLNYPELTVPEAEALVELVNQGWLDAEPMLGLDDLFRLYTLAELRPVFADELTRQGLPKTLAKARLREVLRPRYAHALPVPDWLGPDQAPVVRVQHMALFDRIRLMFFGNLRQSWSDFVLVELGHQRYERVTLSPDSRAFHQREDVDCYLAMHDCRERLDAGVPADAVWADVPAASENPWLSSRRDRLLLELGRQAERQGDRTLALEALTASGHREARLKRLRLLERMKRFDEAWDLARSWQTEDLSDAEAQGLGRLLKRLASRMGAPSPRVTREPPIETLTLTLPPPPSGSVELAARDALSRDDAPVFYVENTLINGLFGLLCWQTIFTAIPGAFFHPFHTGPADLTREDFVARRQSSFDRCFALLEDGGYRRVILDNYAAKQGVANPFVIWPVLTGELVTLALECIPARDLRILFERLLLNIREHRSGFPDLIQFYPASRPTEARYRMIEVKGPGDRLQDHQVRWLAFFAGNGIAASVCYVRWQSDGESG
ncbi:VRR-NUC domain-containing protein [Marinobacter sp. F4206]|uniref:VRR-NUC domain-containing protein n=1 Tax=Marinobacter sp. F4206 TaxID=2861777 RepID=UPI001C5F5A99|nr:VRR-NUC domain-containing protein [Marinobacter sp. F4206]MBW4935048.1 VRR-NUC domain-containing protein [Marinobacter sp. F4206]